MQFSYLAVAAAAFAMVEAVAQFTMPPQSFVGIKAGSPLNITWAGATGPVNILLKNGPANILKTAGTIASGQTGTSFIWTPSASLQDDTYALEIDDGSTINYSVQFALTGGLASSSVISGSSTSTSSGSTSSGSASATTSSGSSTTSGSSSSSTGSASSTSSGSSSASSSASKTGSSTSSSASPTSSAPPGNNNAGASIASPLAMVLLAFAAVVTLN